MDLDHFVCACVVVQQTCELYDKCTVGGPGKSQMSGDQFLETGPDVPFGILLVSRTVVFISRRFHI